MKCASSSVDKTLFFSLVAVLCAAQLSLAQHERRVGRLSRPGVVFPSRGEAWPQPKNQTTGSNVILLDPSTFAFVFVGPPGGCDVADRALKRYRDQLLFNGCARSGVAAGNQRRAPRRHRFGGVPVASISSLLVHLRGQCEHTPQHDMDEAYTLQFTAQSQPSLSANSVWGLLRGLETFSQIVYPYDGTQQNILLLEELNRLVAVGEHQEPALESVAEVQRAAPQQ